jgi:hypothetical protein
MTIAPALAVPRIRTHRAGAGLQWVRQGLRLYARRPLVLVILVGLGPLLLGTLQVVPLLGDLAALILTPAMALGMLNVCRSVSAGSMPGVTSYLAPLHDPVARLRLLQIGVYYVVVAGLVKLALTFVPVDHSPTSADASTQATVTVDAAPVPTGPPAPPEPRQTPEPQGLPAAPDFSASAISLPVFIVIVAIAVPFAMTVWFAPALIGWYRMAAPKALFFSFFACWRNRAAMLVYLVTLLGLWVIAVLILGALIDILNARDGLAPYLLLAPLVFLTLAVGQTANLAMVQDIIDDDAAAPESPLDTAALPPT